MARPLIEFIQSQVLAWTPAPGGSGAEGGEIKLLSRDPQTEAATMLARYPSGFRAADIAPLAQEEEFFILKGDLYLGGRTYLDHHYAYLPEGTARGEASSREGATLLRFLGPRLEAADPAKVMIPQVDTTAMRWDSSNIDPEVNHLYTSRKNLRFAEDGRCRTYLLAGLPQGYPPSGMGRLERHPHVEEFFLIYGDMSCSVGVMRPGAYAWRPPMVWHGLDCSRSGFLLFFRSPGANQNTNLWREEPSPITWSPEHAPLLPAGLKERFPAPIADPIEY